jgi:hypothetical protein
MGFIGQLAQLATVVPLHEKVWPVAASGGASVGGGLVSAGGFSSITIASASPS